MGTLIQTKGTQRLARFFNKRFDDTVATGLVATRGFASSGAGNLANITTAFGDPTLDLFQISDQFIFQNAVAAATWPADGSDVLYPSATVTSTNGSANTSTLHFALPAGFNALPGGSAIAHGSTVCSLDRPSFAKGTFVDAVVVAADGTFTVTLVDKANAAVNVPVRIGEKICFVTGNHQRLVRRWRWYLQHDLLPTNHAVLRNAIYNALIDPSFTRVTFQAIEDTQKVIVSPRSKPNNADEFTDDMIMDILLLTQATTAPDKLDAQ